jgi:hypothetical protein
MAYPSCARQLRVPRLVAVQRSKVTPKLNVARMPCLVETKLTTPSFAEDKETARSAFMKAYEQSLPAETRIPGLQSFAGAVRCL